MSRQEIIDNFLGKTVSKTLMITLIATIALFSDKLSGMEWTIIATAYIGSEKFSKTILMMKDKI